VDPWPSDWLVASARCWQLTRLELEQVYLSACTYRRTCSHDVVSDTRYLLCSL